MTKSGLLAGALAVVALVSCRAQNNASPLDLYDESKLVDLRLPKIIEADQRLLLEAPKQARSWTVLWQPNGERLFTLFPGERVVLKAGKGDRAQRWEMECSNGVFGALSADRCFLWETAEQRYRPWGSEP